MRTPEEVQNEIADMTPEERGALICRIKDYDWSDERKAFVVKFVMMLGLIGQTWPKGGERRKPN